jgi:hypothetical protein
MSFTGDGRQKSTLVVGSEGGAILRCLLKNEYTSSEGGKDSKWTPEAEEVVNRVPQASRYDVRRHVEQRAKEMRLPQVREGLYYLCIFSFPSVNFVVVLLPGSFSV